MYSCGCILRTGTYRLHRKYSKLAVQKIHLGMNSKIKILKSNTNKKNHENVRKFLYLVWLTHPVTMIFWHPSPTFQLQNFPLKVVDTSSYHNFLTFLLQLLLRTKPPILVLKHRVCYSVSYSVHDLSEFGYGLKLIEVDMVKLAEAML